VTTVLWPQVRVQANGCSVPTPMQAFAQDCFPAFAKRLEEKASFGPSGTDGSPAWRWFSAAENGEGSYIGRTWVSFPGSGYTRTLPLDLGEAQAAVAELQEGGWLDLQTRVVFVDLMLHNPNTGLATLVKMATEFPAAGAAIPFVVLRTAPLSSLVLSLASATELTAEILILCQVRLNSLRRSGDTPRSKGALDQYHAVDVCLVC
jgi:hypothetical protein